MAVLQIQNFNPVLASALDSLLAGEDTRDNADPHPLPQAGEVPSEARRRGAPRVKENKSRALAKQFRRRMTRAEVMLWQCLRRDSMEGLRFRRQHPIGPYVADFACVPAKFVVEVDGATQGSNAEAAGDARRSVYLRKRGWHEIRVTNFDVYKNLSFVLEHIWLGVTKSRPPPSRLRRSTSPASGGG